jgi:hypothetical protein
MARPDAWRKRARAAHEPGGVSSIVQQLTPALRRFGGGVHGPNEKPTQKLVAVDLAPVPTIGRFGRVRW